MLNKEKLKDVREINIEEMGGMEKATYIKLYKNRDEWIEIKEEEIADYLELMDDIESN